MAKVFQLGRPELAQELEARLKRGGNRREMERLMALQMAMNGRSTLAQIAAAIGRSRSTLCEWMRIARNEGIEPLLGRHQGKGRAAQLKGKALTGLRKGLQRGRWPRAKDAQQWLAQRHGLKLSLSGMRYWLKKAGES